MRADQEFILQLEAENAALKDAVTLLQESNLIDVAENAALRAEVETLKDQHTQRLKEAVDRSFELLAEKVALRERLRLAEAVCVKAHEREALRPTSCAHSWGETCLSCAVEAWRSARPTT